MSKGQRPFYKGVDFKQFTNKDGHKNGGVEVEVSKPNETQSTQVRGTRNMLSEKKKDADWY